MSFLAPLFLLGALAIIGPIVFHLIRRTTREKTPFSTLMFLQPTPPRVTRRSRLENLWLLLLRCLVLALLALGFARPFVQQELPAAFTPGGLKRIVILVDTSASMQRPGLWDAAKARVAARIRAAGAADEVALVAFERGPRLVLSFDDWRTLAPEARATAAERLAPLAPGWAATHLDSALLFAADLLAAEVADAPVQPEIVIISDLQEGARIEGVQGRVWPHGLLVSLETIRAEKEDNAALAWLPPGESATDDEVRVRVTNVAGAKREQFTLRWAGGSQADAYAPAGQARVVRLPKHADGGALTLAGDEVAFDNTVFVAPLEPLVQPILFLGRDGANDPRALLYYLRRAFPPTRQQTVEIIEHRGDQAVPAFQWQTAHLLVLGENVSAAALASARQFAHEGKTVLAPLTNASSAASVARLLGLAALPVEEAKVKDYALLGRIDFQHPLFAAFADPRYSDFSKIHFWQYRRVDFAGVSGAQIVAQFDDGAPAVIDLPLGPGRVLIFASSWRPGDSQLALASKFVPLLQAALELSSRQPPRRAQYYIGDEVPLGPQVTTVRRPDGREMEVPTAEKFTATELPGIYTILPANVRFAVNVAPEESRLAPLEPERLANLGVPLARAASSLASTATLDPRQAQAVELESRQKLWRWLMAVCFAALLLETLLAGKLTRRAAAV
jgi:hypothetical protein